MHVREKAEKRVDAKIRFQENLFKFIVSNTYWQLFVSYSWEISGYSNLQCYLVELLF